jgi:hypothetical protein
MVDQKVKQSASGQRQRKYWLGCNWKCNGSIQFIKDSVKNMINDVEYNQKHLGKFINFTLQIF